MTASAPAIPSLDGYQLRLTVFEGPLDVLLRLIERDQLEINEVSLLSVFDQFVAYMRTLEAPPPTLIAEFIAVAGRLSVLKSRGLLPKPPRVLDDVDEPDLIRQLEEYRAVKAAAGLLAERQQAGIGVFSRLEVLVVQDSNPAPYKPQTPTELSKAMGRWLTRIQPRPMSISQAPIVSLPEMLSRIVDAINARRVVPFASILRGSTSRQDVAVAFLALLILVRKHALHASQKDPFGTIVMTAMSTADRSTKNSNGVSPRLADGSG